MFFNQCRMAIFSLFLFPAFSVLASVPFDQMPIESREVVILGAGSAGLVAREKVAEQTSDYLVIDPGEQGTTCARTGCMPSKALIEIACNFAKSHLLYRQGLSRGMPVKANTENVMRRVRLLRDYFVNGMKRDRILPWQTVENFVKGHVEFLDAHRLLLDNRLIITAQKIIIATGSSPVIPDTLRNFQDVVITSDEFFEQRHLPSRVAVIGIGFTGLELGQAMHHLGIDTFLIARRKSIAGISDPVLLNFAADYLSKRMNISLSGIEHITRQGNRVIIESGGKTFTADRILVAAGRQPNTSSLRLDRLGLPLNSHGVPEINPATSEVVGAPHIFMAGDVRGEKTIVHEAKDEGAIAGINSLSGQPALFRQRIPLEIIFSHPNIAFVGKRYHELINEQQPFSIGEAFFRCGRSILKSEEGGLLRLYADTSTGRILGSEMMGVDSEYLAHFLSVAIEQQMTVEDLMVLPYYHPTVMETLRLAVESLSHQKDRGLSLLALDHPDKGKSPHASTSRY